jgi:hypothetical protein
MDPSSFASESAYFIYCHLHGALRRITLSNLTRTDGVWPLKGLLARTKKREARDTTDAELNALIGPLRDRVCDFKDATVVSWVHIVPAVQKISVRLLVQARGLQSVRRLYEAMINDFNSRGRIPVSAYLGYSKPPLPPEWLAQFNGMLWEVANQLIAVGHPPEHVAQAFGAFAVMTADQFAKGEDWLVKAVLAETARELQSADYGN